MPNASLLPHMGPPPSAAQKVHLHILVCVQKPSLLLSVGPAPTLPKASVLTHGWEWDSLPKHLWGFPSHQGRPRAGGSFPPSFWLGGVELGADSHLVGLPRAGARTRTLTSGG